MKTLETAWMGRHRGLLDSLSRLLNTYTRQYTTVNELENSGVRVSSVQVQMLKHILEGEGEKMSEIAARMGITRSTFSNNVKRMMDLGYLEKSGSPHSRKEIFVRVTEKGRDAYRVYVDFIRRAWIDRLFELADSIPPQHMQTFIEILDGYTEAFLGDGTVGD